MASTVLPNGIIIPEKYSRDWYNDLYHNWQELDNLLGASGPGDGTLTIQKNGSTVGTFSANQATNETVNISVPTATSELTNDSNFVESSDLATVATSGSYNDLSDKPTIPTVNDATLTIQQNGTTVDTFTANSSSDKTVNIQCVDLTNNQTVAGNKEFTGTTTAHDLVPSATDTYDLGSPSYQWNNAYIKSLAINGVACGDILTHNASEFVPRSGGAVLSSDSYTRTVDNSYLRFGGGPAYDTSASLILFGNSSDYTSGHARIIIGQNNIIYYFEHSNFAPGGANVNLGAPGYEWGQIYSTNSTISTSDARVKNSVKGIDDALLDAWGNIEPKQYKFNDATEKKGEKARLHTGYLAQDIQAECEKQGVNASDYGLFCHDSWEEREEKKDENGQVIEPYRAKGDLYSLRYEEALVVECKYLRRCIARLTARIEELEKGNNTK